MVDFCQNINRYIKYYVVFTLFIKMHKSTNNGIKMFECVSHLENVYENFKTNIEYAHNNIEGYFNIQMNVK